MKTCSQCRNELPVTEFYRQARGKDALQSKCKACCRAYRAEWEARNVERMRIYYRRKALKDRYGQDAPELFGRLMEKQRGVCAICRKPETAVGRGGVGQRLAVDHDHETGEVRGLMCRVCNQTLGAMGDNIQGVMRFVEYLQNPPASSLERVEPAVRWSRDWTECRGCGTDSKRYGGRGYCHACYEYRHKRGQLD